MKGMILAASLVAGIAIPLYGQVDKPQPVRLSTERLPAPANITAKQDPSGPIRVVWSAVDGAVRYSLTRSVPPAGATLVTLPNPTDTVYIDHDVKPGSTYYYLVGAINDGGITGMKTSAPPVTAVAAVPSPPTNFRAAIVNGNTVSLSWNSSSAAPRFRLERGVITGTQPPGWISLSSRPSCCYTDDALQGIPPGTRLQYRIRAESEFGAWSEPVVSNEITIPALATNDTSTATSSDTTTARTQVRPAVIGPATTIKAGESVNLGKSSTFTQLQLSNPRWLSLNESRATVTNKGVVKGVSAGAAHIVAIGAAADGAIASMVQRVDVHQ